MGSPSKSCPGDLRCSAGRLGLEVAARTSGVDLGQCVRGTSGWRSEFLCSKTPLGNSGE